MKKKKDYLEEAKYIQFKGINYNSEKVLVNGKPISQFLSQVIDEKDEECRQKMLNLINSCPVSNIPANRWKKESRNNLYPTRNLISVQQKLKNGAASKGGLKKMTYEKNQKHY